MKKRIFLLIIFIGVFLLLPSIVFADIDTLWTDIFASPNFACGFSVLEAENGDYIFCGAYQEEDLDNLMVGRVNSFGDTIWVRIYDFPFQGLEQGRDIIDIGNDDYIIVGYHIVNLKWDIMLVKVDGGGEIVWKRFYDFGADESAYGVCQTRDGGYLIVGRTSSFDAIGFDIFLVKTDSIGEVQGTYLYKSDGMYEAAYGVDTTADGGYIVACESDSASLLRFDADGNLLWKYGSGGMAYYAVKTRENGEYVAVGAIEREGYYGVYYNLKVSLVNDNGYAYNSRDYGPVDYWTFGYGLDITGDGGYIIAGNTGDGLLNERVYILKTDGDLNELWSRVYGTDADWKYSAARSIKETFDGDYIAVGYRDEGLWLLKLGEVQDVVPDDSTNIPNNYITLTSYPNPFNSETTIKFKIPSGSDNGIVDGDNISKPQRVKLSIYDLFGRKIAQLIDNNLTPGEHSITWNAKNLPSGIYFYRLSSNNKSITKKMVLLK